MSDCACIYVGDYDPITVLTKRLSRSRRERRCCECGEAIARGDVYEYIFGKFDDAPVEYETCADCLSIRHAFFCEGWLYGGILEAVEEHLGELDGAVSSDCIVPLTPRARERVCEMIEHIWERLGDEDDDDG